MPFRSTRQRKKVMATLRQEAASPERSLDTMSEAIALSSPSGRMSERSKAAAQERLRVALFGPEGLQIRGPSQPTEAEGLRAHAARLPDLAGRGMRARAFVKEAEMLERRAQELEAGSEAPGSVGVASRGVAA